MPCSGSSSSFKPASRSGSPPAKVGGPDPPPLPSPPLRNTVPQLALHGLIPQRAAEDADSPSPLGAGAPALPAFHPGSGVPPTGFLPHHRDSAVDLVLLTARWVPVSLPVAGWAGGRAVCVSTGSVRGRQWTQTRVDWRTVAAEIVDDVERTCWAGREGGWAGQVGRKMGGQVRWAGVLTLSVPRPHPV